MAAKKDVGQRVTDVAISGVITSVFFMIIYLVIFGSFSPDGVVTSFLAGTLTAIFAEFAGLTSSKIRESVFEQD